MSLKKLRILAATTLIAGAGIFVTTSTAEAATINIYSDSNGAARSSVECTACSVLLYTANGTDSDGVAGTNNVTLPSSPGSFGFGTGFGELFDNPYQGSSPTSEAAWASSVLGTSFSALDLSKTDGTSDGATYWSSAAYVIIKVGNAPDYTILRNDSGAKFSFTWDSGSGGGEISHYSEISAVPLPAAGFLLIGALGGLAALRRRRKMT